MDKKDSEKITNNDSEGGFKGWLKEWGAVVAFVVALTGGVPGIVQTVDFFKNKPKMTYSDTSSMYFLWHDTVGRANPGLFLVGSLNNSGRSPLTLKRFYVQLYFKEQWIDLIPRKDLNNEVTDMLLQHSGFQATYSTNLYPINESITQEKPFKLQLLLYSSEVEVTATEAEFEYFNKLGGDITNLRIRLLAQDHRDVWYDFEFSPSKWEDITQ